MISNTYTYMMNYLLTICSCRSTAAWKSLPGGQSLPCTSTRLQSFVSSSSCSRSSWRTVSLPPGRRDRGCREI